MEIPDLPKESPLLQGLFQLLMLCHASGIFGQKISLPVAQRDPCGFPRMLSMHLAKAAGEAAGRGLQDPDLFPLTATTWCHGNCGRAANPSEIARGCEKSFDPLVTLEEGRLEAPEGLVRADLPHCSTPVPLPCSVSALPAQILCGRDPHTCRDHF